MVKIFVLYVIILIALAVCGKKEDTASKKVLFYAHLIVGILLTGSRVVHGFGHLLTAPLSMQLTGWAMLLLLLTELILGVLVYKRKQSNLKKVHGLLAILIFCLFFLHLILLKLF